MGKNNFQNTPASITIHPYKETPCAGKDRSKLPSEAADSKTPLPADAKPLEPVDLPPAPTMASGNSCISDEDWKKTPHQVMKEHETCIREYIATLDRQGVVKHLKLAARHEYFDKFKTQCSPSKRFGEKGIEDIVEFDMWLKKLEISEKRASIPKATPTAPVTTPSQPAIPNDGEVSPAQRAAYDGFWKKFKQPRKPIEKVHHFETPAPLEETPAPSEETPAPSEVAPPSEENPTPKPVTPPPYRTEGSGSKETPSCKKRLELEGQHVKGLEWNILYCNHL